MTPRALVALAVLALAAACGQPVRTLRVYSWSDYVAPALVARFEAENHCKVTIDTFDSNEAMYAKLKAGAGGYDLLTPSSYQVKALWAQGMLQPIDHAKVPNLAHLDRDYLAMGFDPAMHHSVPYLLTVTGIAYSRSRVAEFEPTWAMFDRDGLGRRTTMLGDMRETLGAALKSLGYSLNTRDDAQLEAAASVVLRWKKRLARFENEGYKAGLASGEFLMVHAYSGDALQVMRENPDVAFAAPREGTSIASDDLVIPIDAHEVELAHRFIDFLHDPRHAAENTAFTRYLCPNRDAYALLPADLRGHPALFLDPAIRARSEVIDDLGTDNAKYVRAWDRIKSAD